MNSRSVALAVLLALLPASVSQAVNLRVDYSFDTNDFFGAGNPEGAAAGAQARLAFEAAADYFSGILDDSFSRVETPDDFASSRFSGVANWTWNANFLNPSTGFSETIPDPMIAENEFRIIVGGRPTLGSALAFGGPGGWAWSQDSNGGGFTSSELNQINAITATFSDAVENRGDPAAEFSSWGGTVSFDNDGSTNWHFDYTTPPPSNETDFFSVAIHELAHTLGLGASPEWTAFIQGGGFTGANTVAANGGTAPAASTTHFAEGTMSTVFGGFTTQEASLDPTVAAGQRKLFTELDAAALVDLGWTVVPPAGLAGDYNDDGIVDAADYTIWRDSLGTPNVIGNYSAWRANFGATASSPAGSAASTAVPEPAALLLAGLATLAAVGRRR